MKRLLILSLLITAIGPFAATAFAAKNEGQADLDKATEKKLSAMSIEDLGEVINLCESAMKKGLDSSNLQFAKDLYASTLLQRATTLTEIITEHRHDPDAQVATIRRQAIADLNKVVAADAKSGVAYLMLAKLEQGREEDHPEALKAAEKAVELNKDDANLEATALVIRGNLLTDPKKREADYDAALKLTPSDPDAIWTRALFLGDEKHYERSLADLDTLLKIPSQAKRPQVHMARGVVLFELKRNDEAMKAFGRAMELAPNSIEPYVERARIRAEMKDTKGAIDDLNSALQLEPGNPKALLLRAAVYAQDKHFDLAINDLEELLKIAPGNPELNLQIGMFYLADKHTRKSIEKFDLVLAADPKNETAYLERGGAYLSIGKHAEAIHDYEQAIKLKADDSELENNFAWVLCTSPDAKLRDGKRALVLAKQAAEATKYKAAYILSTLAAAYAETGDFNSAIKWSTKAVEAGEKADKEELSKELASYKEKKPWRELQNEDADNPKETKPPAGDKTAEKPAPPASKTETK